MLVIAILIAATIIIFDQISNIWLSSDQLTLWQSTILWLGMMSLVVSFTCLMLCVDSLDTIFNRFSNDLAQNILTDYFYSYTINPRYAATASMYLAMILLLAYHSEILATLAIGIVFCIGYHFWFPNIPIEISSIKEKKKRLKPWCVILIIGFPVLVRIVTYITYA